MAACYSPGYGEWDEDGIGVDWDVDPLEAFLSACSNLAEYTQRLREQEQAGG